MLWAKRPKKTLVAEINGLEYIDGIRDMLSQVTSAGVWDLSSTSEGSS